PPDSLCDVSPGLVDESIDNFDAHLTQASPAIDAGTTDGAPGDDFDGCPRDAQPDLGAYERWEPTAWVYLPLTLRGVSP
ncbi:MAG: choice-of-anchor Q domain-containing protein, partial [Chloroflexota bacterium]